MGNLSISWEEMQARVQKVTENFGICGLLGRNVFDLSGGEKQILALASMLYISREDAKEAICGSVSIRQADYDV